MSILVVGSIALDSIKTPFGEKKRFLEAQQHISPTRQAFSQT